MPDACASLGMYDSPALRTANDALWGEIARRLTARGIADVPPALDRHRPLEAIWRDPGLLLAQVCGYPLVNAYRGHLRYLATPHYRAQGCEGASYRSRIVVRADEPATALAELRGSRAAVNEWQSNSGMNLLRATVAPLARGTPFFDAVTQTGSHLGSVRAVADGAAEVAAIDTVSFVHIARDDPALAARVRTIAWSEPSPGLPFVTSLATPEPVAEALVSVLGEVVRGAEARAACTALLIADVEHLPSQAYDGLADPAFGADRGRL
ncbi:MAG: PhnD/SsuA/transferrin family substrate-binding protein [Rhizorhabdus sp.]